MQRRERNARVSDREKTGAAARHKDAAYTAVYKVNKSDTLMEFLLRKCNTSRNNVKSLLARRCVLVNGSVVTQFDFPLAKDDEVKLARKPIEGNVPPPKAQRGGGERAEKGKKALPQTIKIIYEDEDFIAIDKPAGLLSVESDTSAECAFAYVFEYLRQNGKNARPYVLHRIDKETSGVLVFAKNPKIHSLLKLHWNERVTLREYFAVVDGTLEKKQDTIVSYLKANKNNLMYVTQDTTGEKAITHYEVVKENEKYSLLRVKIDTGKKNQIRVQMLSLGHAVVGDEKYGLIKSPLMRLGLHASRLTFIHPVTKKEISIGAGLPSAFRSLFGEN